jgi:hypothetical protein
MQPPIHFTGNVNLDWLLLAVAFVVALYWLKALRLARQGVRLFLRNAAIAVLIFIGCQLILSRTQLPLKTANAISGFAALLIFLRRKNTIRRSRYIPASVKRKVIARDLKGETYDASKHHLDHRWPFSKGGSNTTDNLRVIPKSENLKKGARRTKWREMGW